MNYLKPRDNYFGNLGYRRICRDKIPFTGYESFGDDCRWEYGRGEGAKGRG